MTTIELRCDRCGGLHTGPTWCTCGGRVVAHAALSDTDHTADPGELLDLCGDAIRYVLSLAQRDPDLGYHLGPMCEAWERLCRAEAALRGVAVDQVREERGRPLWGDRQSEREMLRERIRKLEETA